MKKTILLFLSLMLALGLTTQIAKADNDPVALPIIESFEGDFPPAGWLNTGEHNQWKQEQSVFAYAEHFAQDGEYFAYIMGIEFLSVKGAKAYLTTPEFLSDGKDAELRFWFLKLKTNDYMVEKVNIYLTEDGDVTGLTPLASYCSHADQEPVADGEGWIECIVTIPCSSMETAKIVIEGERDINYTYGSDLCIDNLTIKSIGDDPVSLPILESFEGDFPPVGWTNTGEDTEWLRTQSVWGWSDEHFAPDGDYFAYIYGYDYIADNPAAKGWLITPAFLTEGKDAELTFSFLRMKIYQDMNDKINIYLTEDGDITGLTPLATIHRYAGNEPVVDDEKWYEYTVTIPCASMETAKIVIEGVRDGAMSADLCLDNVQVHAIEYIELPFTESFEGDFPPDGWANTGEHIQWKQERSIWAYSEHFAQDGEYFAYIMGMEFLSVKGAKACLATPAFLTEGMDAELSFQLLKLKINDYMVEKVNVYLTADGDITGLTPLASYRINAEQEPTTDDEGWIECKVTIPCSSMKTAIIVIEGERDASYTYGSDMCVDNIRVAFDKGCIPPSDIMAEIYADEGNPGNNVKITWGIEEVLPALKGFNLYRNDVLIAEETLEMEFVDTNLGAGSYTYSVEAVYDNDCAVSEKRYSAEIVFLSECNDVPVPLNLQATPYAQEWYDVDLAWEDASQATIGYSSEPEGAMAGDEDFRIAMRFSTEDLAEYDGMELSKISFVPYEAGVTYNLKVWTGGGDLNPGTEVYTQAVSGNDLNLELVWNTIELNEPVAIDSSKEMWIGIACEGEKKGSAGVDVGPLQKDGYSNLVYFKGEWTTITAINSQAVYNWCLEATIKIHDGEENRVGFNVYRNGERVNEDLVLEASYRDLVPSGGDYAFAVTAVYDDYCESLKSEAVSVSIESSPCDEYQETPIVEDFEGDRFPSWCWTTINNTINPDLWGHITGDGDRPLCSPQSGNSMMRFNSANTSAINGEGSYISPKLEGGQDYVLSFWMFRENDIDWMKDVYDRLNIHVNDAPEIGETEVLATFNRSMLCDPIEEKRGWYEYRVVLPAKDFESAYVIFHGISDWGWNIYLDNITIFRYDECSPVVNLTAEQPTEGEVLLTWDAPVAHLIDGYKVLKDGEVVAEKIEETSYREETAGGEHKYSVVVLYNKESCQASEPTDIIIDVIELCDPVTDVVAERTGAASAKITWTAPTAINLKDYSIYRNDELIGNADETEYTDTEATPGNNYYGVAANYEKGCETSVIAYSNQIRIEYCEPVIDLTSSVTENSITIEWDFVGEEPFSEVLFHEGFENKIPESWLNLNNDDDNDPWLYLEDEGKEGNCVWSRSFADFGSGVAFPVDPDNWLIMPKIHLKGTETLEYYVAIMNDNYPGDHYGVFISTTGTEFSDFTRIFDESLNLTNTDWVFRSIDLSAYSGDVYIAFRHYNSYNFWSFKLDEVTVRSSWGLPSFNILKDGELIDNITEKSYTDTEVEINVEYNYCVVPVYDTCDAVEEKCIDVMISFDSIDAVAQSKLSAYPNPTKGNVTITNEQAINRVQLFDITGKLLYEVTGINRQEYNMDISGFEDGVYLLNVDGVSKKLIKR